MFVLEMSGKPHLYHHLCAMIFTNVSAPDIFDGMANARKAVRTGCWAVISTDAYSSPALSAVKFSGVFHRSDGTGIQAYGGTQYAPSYNTLATRLHVYDAKLWRSYKSQIAYYDTTTGWSDYYVVGEADAVVKGFETAFGRMYVGKEDSLHVFDQGRLYEIESFRQYADSHNFDLLELHKGMLYFNIRNRLIRLSNANQVERLDIGSIDGYIVGGASVGDELYVVTRSLLGGEGSVVIFDPETGRTRTWINTRHYGTSWINVADEYYNRERGPSSVAAAYGHVFVGPYPVDTTVADDADSCNAPVLMANRTLEAQELNVQDRIDESWAMLPPNDMDLPDVIKLFNRILFSAAPSAAGQTAHLEYSTRLSGPGLAAQYMWDNSAGAYVALTLGTPVTVEVDDVLYFGFSAPPSYIRVTVVDDVGATKFDQPQYVLAASNPTAPIYDSTLGLTVDGVLPIGGGLFSTWVKVAVEDESLYWFRFPYSGGASRTLTVSNVEGIAVDGEAYDWTTLGSVSLGTPLRKAQYAYPLPEDTQGKYIAVRFRLPGGALVSDVQVEHLPILPPLDVIDFGIVAVDNIERLDMVLENSAQFIQASLFSMSKAGLLYTAQLPWPPPTAHTIKARVSLQEPGVHVPVLAYNNTCPGATMSVRLDEMRTGSRAGWGDTSSETGF